MAKKQKRQVKRRRPAARAVITTIQIRTATSNRAYRPKTPRRSRRSRR